MIHLFPKIETFYIEGFTELAPCHEQLFIKELCTMSCRYKLGNVTYREREYINLMIDQIDPDLGDAFMLMVNPFSEWNEIINGIFQETE